MNPQWQLILKTVRKGIESNVRTAIRTMETSRKKDFKDLKKRIDHLADNELVTLRRKMDDIKKSLKKVDALKPYIRAIETATKGTKRSKRRKTRKATPKRRTRKAAPKRRKKTAKRKTAKRKVTRRKRSATKRPRRK